MMFLYILAGLCGGVLTGMAGLTAAMVVTPILCGVCGWAGYDATTISLIANIPAAMVTCYTYYKNGNVDLQRTKSVVGSAFVGAVAGSWLGYLFSQVSESGVSYAVISMNLFLAVKYIKPAKAKKDSLAEQKQKKQQKKTLLAVALAFVIGMECGFMGSAGGALMLMVLTIVLGMDTKLAVGTNSMIMALVALTGAVSHVAMGAQVELIPGIVVTLVCTAAAVVSSRFANTVSERVLNVSTGIVLILVSVLSLLLTA